MSIGIESEVQKVIALSNHPDGERDNRKKVVVTQWKERSGDRTSAAVRDRCPIFTVRGRLVAVVDASAVIAHHRLEDLFRIRIEVSHENRVDH